MQEEMVEEATEEVVEEKTAEAGEAEEEDMPCWNANPGCGSGECTSICPAYVNRTPCWQFDWKSAMEGMDDMSKAELVKLIQNCPNCPVYQKHPKEIKKVISLVMK
jgi:hypothetical protein